ncbi:hypothetical protein GM540_16555, partial [Streptococcus pneumoniae]|nr:hypothetical protein [Streptococcus pneumoniae]
MTLKIEVTIPEDDIKAGAAAQYLATAMSAIGYVRPVATVTLNEIGPDDAATLRALRPDPTINARFDAEEAADVAEVIG